MSLVEEFNIIAFRARQHALHFNHILKKEGYESQMMSTPKGVAMGCGLSLRFSPHLTAPVMEIYRKSDIPIIGFYSIRRIGNCSELRRIHHDRL